jgi:hypothetical protein
MDGDQPAHAPNHKPDGAWAMAARTVLTAARLREVLNYNPETGKFTWKARTKNRWRETVGNTSKQRHTIVRITVDYGQYKAHRLAWLWMTGEWPSSEIDHINRDPLDNRWVNLRLATRSQNHRNHRLYKNNTSGTNGVIWHEDGKRWVVQILGKYHGSFKTKEEATRIALLHRKDW